MAAVVQISVKHVGLPRKVAWLAASIHLLSLLIHNFDIFRRPACPRRSCSTTFARKIEHILHHRSSSVSLPKLCFRCFLPPSLFPGRHLSPTDCQHTSVKKVNRNEHYCTYTSDHSRLISMRSVKLLRLMHLAFLAPKVKSVSRWRLRIPITNQASS